MARHRRSLQRTARDWFAQPALAPIISQRAERSTAAGSVALPETLRPRRGRLFAAMVAAATIAAAACTATPTADDRRDGITRSTDAKPSRDGTAQPATVEDLAGHVFFVAGAQDLATGLNRPLPAMDQLSFTFYDDGTLGGNTCNPFRGTYRIRGDGVLSFQPGEGEWYPCDDIRTEQHAWLVALFSAEPKLTIADGMLTIRSADAALTATGVEGRFDKARLECASTEQQLQGQSDYFTQHRPEWSPHTAVQDFFAARRTPALNLPPLHEDALTAPADPDSTSIVGTLQGRLVLALSVRSAGGTWTVTAWKACALPNAVPATGAPIDESGLFTNAAIEADARLQVTGTLLIDGAPPGCLLLDTASGNYLLRWPDGSRRDSFAPDGVMLPDGRTFSPGETLTLSGALLGSRWSYPFTQLVMASDCATDSNVIRPLRISTQR